MWKLILKNEKQVINTWEKSDRMLQSQELNFKIFSLSDIQQLPVTIST